MDITNNERMRLAATAYRAYMQAALDFPQPVQASVLADAQSADAGARQDAPHLARNAVPGRP
jgi:hypothetical protein